MFENTTLGDLRTILCSSIVRYDNRPTLIVNILDGEEENPLRCIHIDRGEEVYTHWNDPKWNFEPVPLGFINGDNLKGTIYSYRVPNRQYRVGLSSENLHTETLASSCGTQAFHNSLRDSATVLRRGIATSRKNTALSRCIAGEYPSVANALDTLDKGIKYSIGVSRDFAIDGNFCLFFRTDMVGIVKDNGQPSFSRGRDYLQRFWEKANVNRQ